MEKFSKGGKLEEAMFGFGEESDELMAGLMEVVPGGAGPSGAGPSQACASPSDSDRDLPLRTTPPPEGLMFSRTPSPPLRRSPPSYS